MKDNDSDYLLNMFLFSIFGEPVLRTVEELLTTMKLSLIDVISLEYK